MSSAKNGGAAIGTLLTGKTVSRCVVDRSFSMEFGEGELLRIEGEFIVESTTRRHALSAERVEELGPALVVVGKTISWLGASEGGELDLQFEDGTRLHVSPDSQYEAWEVVGRGGFRVVCMPGGALAIWRGEIEQGEPRS
jgi:Family of unknown function (DUF6188)